MFGIRKRAIIGRKGNSISGPAGGDLYGSYPNPRVSKVSHIYTCTATEQVEDLVFADATGRAIQADASSLTTMPGVGIIEEKLTPTTCRVVHYGIIQLTGPITPGGLYFASTTPGAITVTPPAGPNIFQQIGVGLGANLLLVQPMIRVEQV